MLLLLLRADVQSAVDIDGHERSLQEFAGKVTVFVNVASQCGYTDSNYKGEQQQQQDHPPAAAVQQDQPSQPQQR